MNFLESTRPFWKRTKGCSLFRPLGSSVISAFLDEKKKKKKTPYQSMKKSISATTAAAINATTAVIKFGEGISSLSAHMQISNTDPQNRLLFKIY